MFRCIQMIHCGIALLVFPAKESVRKLTEAAKEELRRGCACFETHPLAALELIIHGNLSLGFTGWTDKNIDRSSARPRQRQA